MIHPLHHSPKLSLNSKSQIKSQQQQSQIVVLTVPNQWRLGKSQYYMSMVLQINEVPNIICLKTSQNMPIYGTCTTLQVHILSIGASICITIHH